MFSLLGVSLTCSYWVVGWSALSVLKNLQITLCPLFLWVYNVPSAFQRNMGMKPAHIILQLFIQL